MAVEKPIPKQKLRPITTGTNSATNQPEFLVITRELLKAREKSRAQGAITVVLVLFLIGWKLVPNYYTRRSNRDRVVAFDSNLKTALHGYVYSHAVTLIDSFDTPIFFLFRFPIHASRQVL